MRRAYQKAVTIPLNNVEHLWKEYDQWENNLNRLTAKKFLGERSSAYMTARTALREMRTLTEHINRNIVPRPPQWTEKEVQQLHLWKKYIQWEKSNPLQLDEDSAVAERVAYAYQQAFLALRFYPELWYDFANYYHEIGKPEKAMSVLKQSIEVLPTSLLLHFAYAEVCESRRDLDEAKKAFDNLLERLDEDIAKLKSAAQKEVDKLKQEAEEERANMNLGDDIDGELKEQLREREKQLKKEQDEIEDRMKEQVDVIARACSLVWICYMRFARRTDGIKSARVVFSRARKATNRTYHVFIASALMEYHNSKDANIAGNIFNFGMKSFGDDPGYIGEYLDFLIQMNDDNNTRALFERTLATMPIEKSDPIWMKFLDYENKYGDLAGVQNVEKRRNEAVGSHNPMETFLCRYSYLDIHAIDDLELGGEARKEVSSEAGPKPSDPSVGSVGGKGKERTYKDKKALLEPVSPDRYPRPDLNQWKSFKPSAESSRPVELPAATVPPVPVPEPAVPPHPMPGKPVPSGPPMAWQHNAPPSKTPALPDAVAFFVSNLPLPQMFNGPIIQAAELVDLLRNVIIPLPPQGSQPNMPPPGRGPMGPPPKGMGMHSPSGRDMPPMRGGYGGPGRGRGNFKSRSKSNGMMRGGKQLGKRRMRDDYDDDYSGHKGM
ncbi:uncharacterized protein BYT42DRAFT_592831 [Radiomyces spectabilis]|uniref:uncharacterized protein n=1 Tax=Radiomyces spectabilis TaxID=64574 RepID=UPI002220B967|nr:uncharacterized protein BYT42DRAFT_592831 [Radiomyces spectabilis]KAI8384710.1 hypothetical protein BYT42DRAFT_592831 [Radiomyces spectabilis]